MGVILDDAGEPVRSGRFGGGTINPGGPGPGGTFGFGGGGGLLGASVGPGAGSDSAILRALIRKRYQTVNAPTYAAPSAPSATPAPATAMVPSGDASSVAGLKPWQSGPLWNPPAPAPPAVDPATGLPGDVNFGSGFLGTLNDILRAFLGGGAYGTGPNQAILDSVRARALSDAGAARDRTSLASMALGADPATAASYGLQSDLQGQGGVARALSDASYGELTHQRDFGQNLLMALLGRQGTQNAYNPNQTPWGDIIRSLGSIGAAQAGKH